MFDFKEMWETERAKNKAIIDGGMVQIRVKSTKTGQKLVVVAPYNEIFNEKARDFGGSFMWRTKTWVFKGCPYDEILELARRIYGRESVEA